MIICRPSAAHIWSNCAAAPLFQSRTGDNVETDAAREGTCAAWVAERMVRGETPVIGDTHPNGWIVDRDMLTHVAEYVAIVRSHGGEVVAEYQVALGPYIRGTLDAATTCELTGSIYVYDLKYGYKLVEPTTPQLVIYAAGLLQPHQTRAVLTIHQPRGFHPDGVTRSVTYTADELRAKAEALMRQAEACQAPEPVATPGAHCYYCSAAPQCAALAATVYNIDYVVQSTRHRAMTREEIARELEFLDVAEETLKARKNAVEAEAEQRINQGEMVPGWHMQSGVGKRQWTVDPAIVRLLTGVDPYEQTCVTPAELERRGADKAVVRSISRQPETKRKLARLPADYFERLMK